MLAERLPTLAVPEVAPGAGADPGTWFAPPCREVWLEVGFGAGEHLLAQAAANPTVGLVGCEPYVNGVASLLGLLGDDLAGRVRVLMGDARPLLLALADASLARVFVLFPDPWPKRRHAKRRFFSGPVVAALARVLRPGGELRLATDAGAYAREALLAIRQSGSFRWQAGSAADWRLRPADWPATRYEAKALAAGRNPVYLRFRRE